jgi:succinylglutamate desuccinylase
MVLTLIFHLESPHIGACFESSEEYQFFREILYKSDDFRIHISMRDFSYTTHGQGS